MHSFTGDPSYLETAMRAADFYIEHLPADSLPYWDFDAPYIPNVTPRDSSSATITASGLVSILMGITLSTVSDVNGSAARDVFHLRILYI